MRSSMERTRKLEEIAEILVAASVLGPKRAAEKYGISKRVLFNYRKRLEEDPVLYQLFSEKRAKLGDDWIVRIKEAIAETVEYIKRAAQEADPRDPQSIHSIVGALKILSEVVFTQRILDARATHLGGADVEEVGSLATAQA
jgi:hypothetical protein